MTKTHTIAVFAFDGCQLLDVAGPSSVFGVANSFAGHAFYDVKVISPSGGLIATSCGVEIATLVPANIRSGAVDTIMVVGGSPIAMREAIAEPATRQWLKRRVRSATRFGSICSGIYILAELGEVDGLRVATHWASCDELEERFPELFVDRNSLFVVSGRAWTSAGVSTGIDMALAMVEQDIGRDIADKVAKLLVLYARRPGYQSQFSEVLNVQTAAGAKFAGLTTWLQGQLSKRIDVSALASRCGLSERTFYRKFIAATGQTPAQFIRGARLDLARTLLATNLPLKTVAKRSGLQSATRLNAAFERKFGLSPSTFRKLHHAHGM
jgi:transcriptional regulator GlxA family with amidase domain